MENIPAYVSVVFMITTFVTVGIFLFAVKSVAGGSRFAKSLVFIIPFWLLFQFVFARAEFYSNTGAMPPRLFAFGLAPALVLIIAAFLFARDGFAGKVALGLLTILHTIRIPVELTLAWLAEAKAVPEMMTFHGTNFDIISGLTAPFAYYLSTRRDKASRNALLVWNFLALGLLLNIVITAALSAPSPIQQLAFEQPNVAVLYAPYIWLPTVVVPIVFFSHLSSIFQLLRRTSI